MIWTIAIIFALLWVIGLITAYTLGGYVHVLLVVAVVLLLTGTFKAGTKSGRRRGAAHSAAPASPAKANSGGKANVGGTVDEAAPPRASGTAPTEGRAA